MSGGRALHVVSATPEARRKKGRSRLTNHRDLLPKIKDGRQSEARRFRDLVRAYISDAGGIENCSEVRLGLIRRLASAVVLSEELELRAINGEPISVSEFCTLASTTVRISQRLGLNRVPRDAALPPPRVADYVEHITKQCEATS